MQKKLKLSPPVGQYAPKFELVDQNHPTISFAKDNRKELFKRETVDDMAADFSTQLYNLQNQNKTQ